MLNHAIIQGRFTAKPELKTTAGGTSVTSFTLAVERDFRDKETGERAADFINCVAWKGTAELVTRYFDKGRMAIVGGRIQVRDYTDKDGNKRRATEIVAESVHFADSGNAGQNTGATPPATAAYQPEQLQEFGDEEELPF